MKKPLLSKLIQFCGLTEIVEFYISAPGLSLREKKRIWDVNHYFPLAKNPIDMRAICKIMGNWEQACKEGRSPNTGDERPIVVGWWEPKSEESYIRRIEEEFHNIGINKKHLTIEPLDYMYIPEASDNYYANYKITIKGLVINANFGDIPETLFFDRLDREIIRVGIHLVFEDNYFVSKNHGVALASFSPANEAYLIFKDNKFKSVNMRLHAYNSCKIELMGNIFIDSNVEIISDPRSIKLDDVQLNAVCLENNIFYRNDDISSKLAFSGEKDSKCYFRGKNTVDNLIISTDGFLHWDGYQNIDPQGKHAYAHKKIFMGITVPSNDKVQEAKLRRELLKCERASLCEKKAWYSSQDRFILGWSFWVSDYGVSWIRPLLWIAFINFLLTTVIVIFYFFNPECLPEFSYDKWWFLFAELFSPLSNLSNLTTKDSGWISFFNIAQKAILAATYYEIIKIFRRFSK